MSVDFTPTPLAAGTFPTAAQLNESGADAWTDIQAAWDSYTATWTGSTTNPVIGDGTITGVYMRVGKTIHYRVTVTIGSTTTLGSGGYFLSLPVASASPNNVPIGVGSVFDTSTGALYGRVAIQQSTTRVHLYDNSNGRVNPTTPIALAAGDVISATGTYEAA